MTATSPLTPEEIAAHEKHHDRTPDLPALSDPALPSTQVPDIREARLQRDRRAELARLRELRRSLPPTETEEASQIADRMTAIKRLMRAGGG